MIINHEITLSFLNDGLPVKKSEIASKCVISDLFLLNRGIKRPKNPFLLESMEVFLTLLYLKLDSEDKGVRKHLKDWHPLNPFLS